MNITANISYDKLPKADHESLARGSLAVALTKAVNIHDLRIALSEINASGSVDYYVDSIRPILETYMKNRRDRKIIAECAYDLMYNVHQYTWLFLDRLNNAASDLSQDTVEYIMSTINSWLNAMGAKLTRWDVDEVEGFSFLMGIIGEPYFHYYIPMDGKCNIG